MINALRMGFLVVVLAWSWNTVSPLAAEDFASRSRFEEAPDESLYYRQPEYRPNPRAIIHQKAQARASRRQARLASLAWYNMSTGRPPMSSTPFTSSYGPRYVFPSSRPVPWHSVGWPTYVYYAH